MANQRLYEIKLKLEIDQVVAKQSIPKIFLVLATMYTLVKIICFSEQIMSMEKYLSINYLQPKWRLFEMIQ